jgi:acyl-CoA reductase-like NAD-dependent aldehyde dehydrogenase
MLYWADLAESYVYEEPMAPITFMGAPQRRILRREPAGVVGAITPWNFPVLLGVWKIAPALLAGNTIVLKPSPYTPLSTLKLGEILRDALPAGVLNVVSGNDQLGAWITSHLAVRKVSFTGSVATGKKVAAACAPDLKRMTLELGGNTRRSCSTTSTSRRSPRSCSAHSNSGRLLGDHTVRARRSSSRCRGARTSRSP